MTRYSKELNQFFEIDTEGNFIFADGIVYSPDEVSQLIRLRTMNKRAHAKLLPAIHRLKKAFDVQVGLILTEN